MLGIFKRNRKSATTTDPKIKSIPFKDGSAAFKYACEYMDCSVGEGVSSLALVVDSREVFGTSEAVKVQSDGNQAATLKVASRDGGFVVLAATAGPNGPKLEPGQLVQWQAGEYMADLGENSEDKRSGWLGLIVCTLKPEYDVERGVWIGEEEFCP